LNDVGGGSDSNKLLTGTCRLEIGQLFVGDTGRNQDYPNAQNEYFDFDGFHTFKLKVRGSSERKRHAAFFW
jgi:hypothetical protein